MLCRLCGSCVCRLIGDVGMIGSDCGEMSGQKSLRGRRLCTLYSLSRYVLRLLARAIRLLRCRCVRRLVCFFPGFFEVGLRGGLLCVLLLSEGGCLMRGSEGGDNEIWCGIASVGAGD